jgi:hypothetical protein
MKNIWFGKMMTLSLLLRARIERQKIQIRSMRLTKDQLELFRLLYSFLLHITINYSEVGRNWLRRGCVILVKEEQGRERI